MTQTADPRAIVSGWQDDRFRGAAPLPAGTEPDAPRAWSEPWNRLGSRSWRGSYNANRAR